MPDLNVSSYYVNNTGAAITYNAEENVDKSLSSPESGDRTRVTALIDSFKLNSFESPATLGAYNPDGTLMDKKGALVQSFSFSKTNSGGSIDLILKGSMVEKLLPVLDSPSSSQNTYSLTIKNVKVVETIYPAGKPDGVHLEIVSIPEITGKVSGDLLPPTPHGSEQNLYDFPIYFQFVKNSEATIQVANQVNTVKKLGGSSLEE
ncbi:MAG: hypothetical protein GY756_00975 [bacterium]|nr:hypothetical protein [bacterium]